MSRGKRRRAHLRRNRRLHREAAARTWRRPLRQNAPRRSA